MVLITRILGSKWRNLSLTCLSLISSLVVRNSFASAITGKSREDTLHDRSTHVAYWSGTLIGRNAG